MAASKLWLLVADAGRAAVYETDAPRGPLREVQDFIDPNNRLPEQELARDRPGRTFDSSGAGRHAMEPHTPPAQVETERFAGVLADAVETGLHQTGPIAVRRFVLSRHAEQKKSALD